MVIFTKRNLDDGKTEQNFQNVFWNKNQSLNFEDEMIYKQFQTIKSEMEL